MKKETNEKIKCCKFLKPTWKKVLFAVLFFGIFYFLFPIPCITTTPVPDLSPDWSVCPLFASNFFNIFNIVGRGGVYYFGINSPITDLLSLILIIIISYLLSSLIIFKIQNKSKKK